MTTTFRMMTVDCEDRRRGNKILVRVFVNTVTDGSGYVDVMSHRRKTQAAMRPVLDSSALSSDDDDSLYDSSITSILTESHLQTSSC